MDAFDRRIIDVLSGSGGRMTLAELVRDSGFARSTVVTIWSGLEPKDSYSRRKSRAKVAEGPDSCTPCRHSNT